MLTLFHLLIRMQPVFIQTFFRRHCHERAFHANVNNKQKREEMGEIVHSRESKEIALSNNIVYISWTLCLHNNRRDLQLGDIYLSVCVVPITDLSWSQIPEVCFYPSGAKRDSSGHPPIKGAMTRQQKANELNCQVSWIRFSLRLTSAIIAMFCITFPTVFETSCFIFRFHPEN